jgi:hypothetical protein
LEAKNKIEADDRLKDFVDNSMQDYVNLMGNTREFHNAKVISMSIQILMLWMKESFCKIPSILKKNENLALKNKERTSRNKPKLVKLKKPKGENAKSDSKETKAPKVEKRRKKKIK